MVSQQELYILDYRKKDKILNLDTFVIFYFGACVN